MLKSSLYDYSDTYMLVKRTKTVTGPEKDADSRLEDERDKQVTFSKIVLNSPSA